MLDVCTFVGPWPFAPLRYERVDDLLRLMDRAGIARALVSPLQGAFYPDPGPANDVLASEVAAHPDRLFLAAAANPLWPGWEESLRQAREQWGARAVRLFPNYHGYEPAVAGDLAEVAATLGLPVLVTVRLQDERHHPPAFLTPAVSWEAVAALAAAHPAAKVVMSMGRFAEVLEALKRVGGLWADLAGVQGPQGCVDRLAGEAGGRLLFGSEMLLQYPEPAMMKVAASGQEKALVEAGRLLLE